LNKGNYHKLKTKKFLIADGYQVDYLEKLQRIVTRTGQVIHVKKDLLESDGYAVNATDFILWNVTDKAHVSEHVKRYESLVLPPFIRCWIIIWEPRSREPTIIEVKEGQGK
jgi:hypothetical protein